MTEPDKREERAVAREERADATEVRADAREVRAEASEDRADATEIRADAREVRADARETRADAIEVRADAREIRADATEGRTETITDRLLKSVRLLVWMCFVIFVLLVGGLLRSFVVQNQVDAVDDALARTENAAIVTGESAENAKISADATLKELRAAIATLNAPGTEPELSNQAVISALEAITRIETFLCNGVCPEP